MSDREADGPPGANSPIVEWVVERYEAVTLAVLAAFMLWVRLRSYDKFVTDGEVLFSGNDPYYHLRQVSYTVRHWPATMPFDPWTYYPYGTNSGQFGTLFDQVVATAALVVGLGNPSSETIALTLLVTPAILGALTVVPSYYAGKRVGGTIGGLFGAVVLALLPGSFLQRTLVGFSDHHAGEILLQMTAVLAFMVAFSVADREKPVYELVVDRDYGALRQPAGWAAFAGIAMGMYVWTWPPAILLIAIVGVFVVIKMASDYFRGHSPEPVAFAAVVSMTVTGVLSMMPLTSIEFTPTGASLLQPVGAFGVAVGAAALAWLARRWDDQELDRRLYPVAIGGIVAVGSVVISQLLPGLWSTLVNNFQRFIGFSAGAGTRTISEAQPFLNRVQPNVIDAQEAIMMEYGLMFFTALLALTVMLAKPLFTSEERADHATLIGGLATIAIVWQFEVGQVVVDLLSLGAPAVTIETAIVTLVLLVAMVRGDHEAEHLFVAVWALFMTAAAFTQVRFTYYLALAVVVLNAYAMGGFLQWINVIRPDGSVTDEVEPYQMIVLMLALLAVVPVLLTPMPYYEQNIGQGQTQTFSTDTAISTGNSTAPGAVTDWYDTLQWMNESTPKEGTYGGADNGMDKYGTYEQTDDFQYESGAYGVMSWWDYGHWITVEGNRIPNANPFQQGATNAANFLLAPNESHASEVLNRGAEGPEETKYVVVDSKMANPYGKFSAPTVFYDDANVSFANDFVSPWHFVVPDQNRGGRAQRAFRLNKQRYYESMMVRLYRFNGSRTTPTPVVINYRQRGDSRELENVPGSENFYRQFRSVSAAHQHMKNNNDTSYAIGGLGSWTRETVPAVEQYRLVRASEETTRSGRSSYPAYLTPTSKVKVFEKVEGAKIKGSGAPANETVLASVDMQLGSKNSTFTYSQQVRTDQNGDFTMTVPYSTTGYDERGTEQGYTNVSVRATGPYRISTNLIPENGSLYTYRTEANVSETKVIGESTSPVRVTLEKEEVELQQPGNNTSDGGNATGSENGASDSNAPAANNTTIGQNDTSDGDTRTSDDTNSMRSAQAGDAAPMQARGAGTRYRAAIGVYGSLLQGRDASSGADGSPMGSVPQWALVLVAATALLFEVRDERGR